LGGTGINGGATSAIFIFAPLGAYVSAADKTVAGFSGYH